MLFIGGQNIGDSGAEAFAQALESNTALEELIMWWNIIGDAGAEALTRSLLLNRTLRELKVLVNTIGEAGCQALQDVQDAKRQRGETFFIEGLEGQRSPNGLRPKVSTF